MDEVTIGLSSSLLARVAAEAMDCADCVSGDRWYENKHRWIVRMADKYGKDRDAAFVVYAVNSQQMAPSRNDELFREWCESGKHVHMYETVRDRGRLADAGRYDEAMTYKGSESRKVPSFHENLRYPWRHSETVTNDRIQWRIEAATVEGHGVACVWCARRLMTRKGAYQRAQDRTAALAERFGTTAARLQARVWCHWNYCKGSPIMACGEHADKVAEATGIDR